MNVKKFAQDKAKKVKYQKFLKQNKQNLCSVDDSKFKQFSVDLHKLSTEQQYGQRNIKKQQISIFLQNQSQNKTFNEKNLLEVELKKFVKKLDQNNGSMRDFLDAELQQDDQIRTDDIRRLIGTLARKLDRQSTQSSYKSSQRSNQNMSSTTGSTRHQSNIILTQQIISPYLKQELIFMQKQLTQLRQSKHQFEQFIKIQKQQKQYIRHTLESVYKRQLQQFEDLESY